MRELIEGAFLWVLSIVIGFLLILFFYSNSIDKQTKKVIGIILAVLFIVGSILYGGR
jgi:Ca2+/Na+ antiporter